MLSVIVHGRNDAHGYNLHKRVALSLNCISELLDNDDEIIFVDWNTDDALPTLPQAIADTLTSSCRKHLRVLRVRPNQHQRFAHLTHLPVLDAPARNVAIRRANPQNRWLLSTTTDAILVPRRGAAKLREIVEPLAPALYHVPRFDLPETFWEALDRRDPARAIEFCAEWGWRLHLNEVVEADEIVKYDGPGDFQLLPLAAAKELCGFDERMLFTYHMDSNLAKRASLALGPVRSLLDDLFLYHCNHYRQGSVHHASDRAENSLSRFFANVEAVVPPGQAQNWGLADDEVEEIALTGFGKSAVADALANVVRAPDQPFCVAQNPAARFNHLDYQPEHVLPFVADLFATLPRGAELGVLAAGTALLRLLAASWRDLGFRNTIMVLDAEGLDGLPLAAVPEATMLQRADALLFDFGIGEPHETGFDPGSRNSLASLTEVFHRAVAYERELARGGRQRRQRFVVVNAINTQFERLVANHLAFTYTPFTGRVRHGVVALDPDPLATDIAGLAAWLAQRLNRARVPLQEVVEALDLLTGDTGIFPPVSAPILALLSHPRLPSALGFGAEDWRQRSQAIAGAKRNAKQVDPCLSIRGAGQAVVGRQPLSKLAAIDDWERADWYECLRACDAAADSANFFRRHRATWETVQLIYAAQQAAAPGGTGRVRVILPAPNGIVQHLARRYAAVEIIAAGGGRGSQRELIARDAQGSASVIVLDGAVDQPTERSPVDVVIAPDNGILAGGVSELAAAMCAIDRWVAADGIVVFAAEVAIAGGNATDRIPASLAAGGRLQRLVGSHVGWVPLGDSDWSLHETTLDRLAISGTASESMPHFVIQIGNLWSTTAVWAWRKTADTPPARWERLQKAIAEYVDT